MIDFLVGKTMTAKHIKDAPHSMFRVMVQNLENLLRDPKEAAYLSLEMHKKHVKGSHSTKKSYYTSVYWLILRRYLKDSRGHCEQCEKPIEEDATYNIHHNSYDYVAMEWLALESVNLLCPECHKKIHNKL